MVSAALSSAVELQLPGQCWSRFLSQLRQDALLSLRLASSPWSCALPLL
jgi:hypothetical protein